MTPVSTDRNRPGFRKWAAYRFIIGIGGATLAFAFVIQRAKDGHDVHGVELLFLPFIYGCVGAVEFFTGIPFQDIVERWTRLTRSQQIVIGTSVITLGSAVIIYSIWTLFRWLK